jgi:hypothetical protein
MIPTPPSTDDSVTDAFRRKKWSLPVRLCQALLKKEMELEPLPSVRLCQALLKKELESIEELPPSEPLPRQTTFEAILDSVSDAFLRTFVKT